MLNSDDSQIKQYQSLREKYRQFKGTDISSIPDYMKI